MVLFFKNAKKNLREKFSQDLQPPNRQPVSSKIFLPLFDKLSTRDGSTWNFFRHSFEPELGQRASDERLTHGATVLLDLELNFGEREKVLGIICLFKERIQTVTRVRSVKNINFFVSVGAPQHDKTAHRRWCTTCTISSEPIVWVKWSNQAA